jgi:hypothetical protein
LSDRADPGSACGEECSICSSEPVDDGSIKALSSPAELLLREAALLPFDQATKIHSVIVSIDNPEVKRTP